VNVVARTMPVNYFLVLGKKICFHLQEPSANSGLVTTKTTFEIEIKLVFLLKFKFFLLEINFFSVFKLFLLVNIKNKILKIKNTLKKNMIHESIQMEIKA
jgi:hypothetical protein